MQVASSILPDNKAPEHSKVEITTSEVGIIKYPTAREGSIRPDMIFAIVTLFAW